MNASFKGRVADNGSLGCSYDGIEPAAVNNSEYKPLFNKTAGSLIIIYHNNKKNQRKNSSITSPYPLLLLSVSFPFVPSLRYTTLQKQNKNGNRI